MTKLDEYIHIQRKEDWELSHAYEDENGNVISFPFRDTTHTIGELFVRVDPVRLRMDSETSHEYQKDAPNILVEVEKHVRNQLKKEFVKMALEELTSDELRGNIMGVPIKICYRLPEKTILVSPDLIQILGFMPKEMD